MKHVFKAWCVLIAAIVPGWAYSCDICGCSSGASSLGIASMLNNNFVGLKLGYDPFISRHPATFFGEKEKTIHESFIKAELRAKINLGLKYRLMLSVPYIHYNRQEVGIHSASQGLGDQNLLVLRNIRLTAEDAKKKWLHQMQVGAGIKMPFGKKIWADEGLSNPLLQPGTGSWDFPLQLNYMAKKSKVGIFTETGVRLNTENKDGYRFGNMYSAFTGAMKRYEWDHLTLSGILGFQGESRGSSHLNGKLQEYTAARAIYLAPVVDLVYKNMYINTGCLVPLAQNISEGYTTVQSRYFFSIHYLFNNSSKS